MKKFIVDKVELMEDGFKYYAIFDKDNKDWYNEQKYFKDATLKIMYSKDTLKVLSINKDVSMIAPTMSGDVVEETEWQEVDVNPNLYFVGGKLVELKDYETIKNGEIEFDRAVKIEYLKAELSNLKTEYSEKEFLFQGKYWQKNREKGDRDNLTGIVVLLMATGQTEYDGWKVIDKDTGEHVYLKLSLNDLKVMALHMQEQVTKALKTESSLIKKLETLTDEELKNYDSKERYEKFWNEAMKEE